MVLLDNKSSEDIIKMYKNSTADDNSFISQIITNKQMKEIEIKIQNCVWLIILFDEKDTIAFTKRTNDRQQIQKLDQAMHSRLFAIIHSMKGISFIKKTIQEMVSFSQNKLQFRQIIKGGGCGSSSATITPKKEEKQVVIPQKFDKIQNKAQKLNRANTIYQISDKQFTNAYKIIVEEYQALDEKLQEDVSKEMVKKDEEKKSNPQNYESSYQKIEAETDGQQTNKITNLSSKIQTAFVEDNFFEKMLADTHSRMQYKPFLQDLFWKNIECLLRKSKCVGYDFKSKDIITKKMNQIATFKKDCGNNSKKTPLLDCIFFTELLLHIYKIYEKQYEEKNEQFMERAKLMMNIFMLAYNIYKMDMGAIAKEIKNIAQKAYKKYEQYQSEQIFDSIVDIWQLKITKFTEDKTDDEKDQFFRKLSSKRIGSEFDGFEEDEIIFYMDLITHSKQFVYSQGKNEKQIIYILTRIDYLITVNFMQAHQSNLIKQNTKPLKEINSKNPLIKEFLDLLYKIHRVKIGLLEVFDLTYLKRQVQFSALMVIVKLWRIFHLQYINDQPNERSLVSIYDDSVVNQMWFDICYTFASKGEAEVETIFYYSGETLSKQLEFFFEDESNFKKLTESFKEDGKGIEELKQQVFRKMVEQWIRKVQDRQSKGITQKDDVLLEVKDFYINQKLAYLSGNTSIINDQSLSQNQKNKEKEGNIVFNPIERHAIQIVKESFLKSNDCKILAILAEGGTGKSMFLKKLELDLLSGAAESKEGEEICVPLLIKCNALNALYPNIEEALKTGDYEMSELNIKSLKSSEMKQKVILLDGYDEYSGDYFVIYEKLRIADWKNTKVILTSRKEKIDEVKMKKYVKVEQVIDGRKVEMDGSYCITDLQRFDDKSVKEYQEMYFNSLTKKNHQQTELIQKTQEEVNLLINSFSQLSQKRDVINLVKLPINLYLLTRLMGELSAGEISNNTKFSELSEQSSLQELFFEYQFQREAHGFKDVLAQHKKKKYTKQQLDNLQALTQDQYNLYFQSIAMKMFLQKGKVDAFLSIKQEEVNVEIVNELKQELGDKELEYKLIDRIQNYVNSQIVSKVKKSKKVTDEANQEVKQEQEKTNIEFKHKSLFEYFTARAMIYDFEKCQKNKQDIQSLDLKVVQNFSINSRLIMKKEQNESEGQVLVQLNKYLIKEVTRKVRNSGSIKMSGCIQVFIDYIYLTRRHTSELDIGSSNLVSAILFDNILTFDNLDLGSCSFPYAYLYGCKQSTVNFTNSNLGQAFLTDSTLQVNKANTLNAQMSSMSLSGNIIGHKRPLIQIAASPNGQYLVSLSYDSLCYIWNLQSQKFEFIKKFQAFSDDITKIVALTFTQDSKYMLLGYKNSIKLYSTKNESFEQVSTIDVGVDIAKLLFNKSGSQLIIISQKGSCQIHDATDSQYRKVSEINGHSGEITNGSLSKDGKYLLTCSKDKTCHVRDTSDYNNILYKIEVEYEVRIAQMSADNKYIFLSDNSYLMKLFEFDEDGYYHREETGYYIKYGDHRNDNRCHNDFTDYIFITSEQDNERVVTVSRQNELKVWKNVDEMKLELVQTIKGHSSEITSSIITQDEKYVITCGYDQSIKVWNTRDGTLVKGLIGSPYSIASLALSNDENYLALGCTFNDLTLWKMENSYFQYVKVLTSLHGPVSQIQFSKDDKRIVICRNEDSPNQSIQVFEYDQELKDYNQKLFLVGHKETVKCFQFSPDGKYLLTGSLDKTCKIWNAQNDGYSFIKDMFVHPSAVHQLAFNPSGSHFVTGSADSICRLWSVDNLDFKFLREFSGLQGIVKSISLSSDGQYLAASAQSEKRCFIWKISNNSKPNAIIEDHQMQINSICFSPDSKYLVTGSDDQTCKVWNAETGLFDLAMSIGEHTNKVTCVAFTKDGSQLITGSEDQTCKFWSVSSGFELVQQNTHHKRNIICLEISEDGKYLITASEDRSINIWSIEHDTFNFVHKIKEKERITSIAMSKDNKYIAVSLESALCKVYDNLKNKLIQEWTAHSQQINSIAFSYDLKYFASCSDEMNCKIWEVDNQFANKIVLKQENDAQVCMVRFCPNKKYFASAQQHWNIVTLYNSETFALILHITFASFRPNQISFTHDSKHVAVSFQSSMQYKIFQIQDQVFTTHQSILYDNNQQNATISFSKDGQSIAMSALNHTAEIFSFSEQSMQLVNQTTKTESVVSHIAFSQNKKLLITNSNEPMCKVWNISSSIQQLKPSSGHLIVISQMLFSPKGKYLLTTTYDHLIKIWATEGDTYCIISEIDSVFQHENIIFFSQNEELLFVGEKTILKVFKVQKDGDFTLYRQIQYNDYLSRACFNIEGTVVAVSFMNNYLSYWDLSKENPSFEYFNLDEFKQGYSIDLKYSHDNKFLAAIFSNGCLIINKENKMIAMLNNVEGSLQSIQRIEFHPNNEYCAIYSDEYPSLYIFKIEGESFLLSQTIADAHSNPLNGIQISSSGKLYSVCFLEKKIKVWNWNDENKQYELSKTVDDVTDKLITNMMSNEFVIGKISPCFNFNVWDEQLEEIIPMENLELCPKAFNQSQLLNRIAIGYSDKRIVIWKRENNQYVKCKQISKEEDQITCLSWNSEGKQLAICTKSGQCSVWNSEQDKYKEMRMSLFHPSEITSVQFSSNKQYLATSYKDSTIKIWDAQNKFSLIKTIQDHSDSVNCIKFSIDSKYLISASADKSVKVWKCDKSEFSLKQTMEQQQKEALDLSFSKDSKLLAIGFSDASLDILSADSTDFKIIKTIKTNHKSVITAVAYSPTKNVLVTGSKDFSCIIFDTTNDEYNQIRVLEEHTSFISSLSFSQDGKYLATASWDKTCKVWDTENNEFKYLKDIASHLKEITCASFNPSGQSLATGSYDLYCKITQGSVDQDFLLYHL